jgi:hypothetical protein
MMTKIFLLLAGAVAALALVISLEPDPSVEGGYFQARLRTLLHRNAYSTSGPEDCDPQEATPPLEIQWHPRRWYPRTPSTDVVGYHDGVEHQTVTDRNSRNVDCFIRYLDGRACFIMLRAEPAAIPFAKALHSVLAHEFPDLPIELHSRAAS